MNWSESWLIVMGIVFGYIVLVLMYLVKTDWSNIKADWNKLRRYNHA